MTTLQNGFSTGAIGRELSSFESALLRHHHSGCALNGESGTKMGIIVVDANTISETTTKVSMMRPTGHREHAPLMQSVVPTLSDA